MNHTEEYALLCDREDPLKEFRSEFSIPKTKDGKEAIYMCGNSLGLMPKSVRDSVNKECDMWAEKGVEGHFEGTAWYSYHEQFREPLAHIVGALPHEVVAMNSLTTNLHLMMVSFYRPTKDRFKIVMEANAFPSDRYAMFSQAEVHGFDPQEAVVQLKPSDGIVLTQKDVEDYLEQNGESVALVMLGGVHYYTGTYFDLERITEIGHKKGCVVGFDLAHAAGNVPLKLHDWNVDFAVWCTYKYLNGGPGGVGCAFVHDNNCKKTDKLKKFAGWWGNDPSTRFNMEHDFVPVQGADAWNLSNAPVFTMACLKPSLDLFYKATMPKLREKSVKMSEYFLFLVDRIGREDVFQVLTPRKLEYKGCQVSLRILKDPPQFFDALRENDVIGDIRKPDVIRVSPVPMYNTFHDVWRFAQILEKVCEGMAR